MPIIGSIGGGSAGGFGQRKGGIAPIAADYLIVGGGASQVELATTLVVEELEVIELLFLVELTIEILGGDNTVTVGAGGAAIVNPPSSYSTI
jgi:hypothetical protein